MQGKHKNPYVSATDEPRLRESYPVTLMTELFFHQVAMSNSLRQTNSVHHYLHPSFPTSYSSRSVLWNTFHFIALGIFLLPFVSYIRRQISRFKKWRSM